MLKLRRPPPRPRRALSRGEVEQLLTREDISLCERTLWRMLYELLAQPRDVTTLRERFASWPRA